MACTGRRLVDHAQHAAILGWGSWLRHGKVVEADAPRPDRRSANAKGESDGWGETAALAEIMR